MAYLIEYVNTSAGVTINLNGYNSTYQMTLSYLGDIGIGLAPMHHITARGPQQDGDTYIDFRLDPRVIQIPLLVRADLPAGRTQMEMLYRVRNNLLRFINVGDEGYLRISSEDTQITTYRRIPVQVVGGMTFDADSQNPYNLRTVIQFRAADPLWYDETTVYDYYQSTDFGINRTYNNTASYKSYPIITIAGPVTDCRFSVTQYGVTKFVQVDGIIGSGATIIINLKDKTVVDGGGVNRIGRISADSNFVNLAIEKGSQTHRVTGTATGVSTRVDVEWTPRYIGI